MKQYTIKYKKDEAQLPETQLVWAYSNSQAKKLFRTEFQGMKNAIILSCRLVK